MSGIFAGLAEELVGRGIDRMQQRFQDRKGRRSGTTSRAGPGDFNTALGGVAQDAPMGGTSGATTGTGCGCNCSNRYSMFDCASTPRMTCQEKCEYNDKMKSLCKLPCECKAYVRRYYRRKTTRRRRPRARYTRRRTTRRRRYVREWFTKIFDVILL